MQDLALSTPYRRASNTTGIISVLALVMKYLPPSDRTPLKTPVCSFTPPIKALCILLELISKNCPLIP